MDYTGSEVPFILGYIAFAVIVAAIAFGGVLNDPETRARRIRNAAIRADRAATRRYHEDQNR